MSILSQRTLYSGTIFKRMLPAQPCLLCGAGSRDGLCCTACSADLPQLGAQHCPVCALPAPDAGICGACLRHPPHFAHTVAAFEYAFPADKLVQALKFREHLILANYLADALCRQVDETAECLVALPLHPARLRERGFNQSLLLARRLAQRLHIPLLHDACARVRDTPPQSRLPLRQRNRNMRDAFVCNERIDVRGKHVAVVDDVMTTGASMEALARALKRAGALRVSAWVVARTLPRNH